MIEEIVIPILTFIVGLFACKITTKYFNSNNKAFNLFSNNNKINQNNDNDK